MGIHKTDRDEVVASALYKFRVNGYHKTSMADIGAGCGLLKGSIYHYFPSKEALAEAALAQVIDENQQRIFSLAYTDRPAKERLEAFAQALHDCFIHREGGCLFGNLALEVTNSVPAFASPIRRYFDDWSAALAHVLEAEHGAERARDMARDSVSQTQGAIMLMRVDGDPAPFTRAIAQLRALLA